MPGSSRTTTTSRRAPGCRRPSGARPARAFTLIELTLVIATIAVLTAIAVPKYAQSMNRYRVDIAAKRVVADLALARSAGRASAVGQVIDFATPANGYTLTDLAAPDGRTGSYAVKLADEPYRVSITSAAFGTASPAAKSVRFSRYGTPEAGGTVVIASGGYQRTIQLDPVTGRAEVR
jgi:Tfp pilus assembly protein FimT